jgi:Rad3-related DNA helicase
MTKSKITLALNEAEQKVIIKRELEFEDTPEGFVTQYDNLKNAIEENDKFLNDIGKAEEEKKKFLNEQLNKAEKNLKDTAELIDKIKKDLLNVPELMIKEAEVTMKAQEEYKETLKEFDRVNSQARLWKALKEAKDERKAD